MELAVVEWEDIVVSADWEDDQSAITTETHKCKSVGWVAVHDDSRLILIHGMGHGDDKTMYNPYTVIPVGTITKITYWELD